MTPSKLTIIPNGVGAEVLMQLPGPVPTQVQEATTKHPFNVGFVGTLGTANALDALIGAARLLSNEEIGFVLVGQGSDEERLRAMVADLDNISIHRARAKR